MIYIQEGQLLDEKPKNEKSKIEREETIKENIIDGLDYDDTPPIDDNGKEIKFDGNLTKPNMVKIHSENRKKK